MNQDHIRNFCIIAHIDHGKSTLADRFLEITKTVDNRKMREQYLDTMELEQERGITIKLQPVRMTYHPNRTSDNKQLTFNSQESNVKGQMLSDSEYTLNLIDTPGHVDFTYEVSRALAACEGAVLVVDATQGIQAQTLANLYLALDQNLEIIPVLNKIDLPNAEPERVSLELENILGFKKDEILKISAKTGEGVEALLEKIIAQVPSPKGAPENPARALIFDSNYDKHRGVVAFVRMVDGTITSGEKLQLIGASAETQGLEVGYFRPNFVKTKALSVGEVGYIVTDFRDVSAARVGDTVTNASERDVLAKKVQMLSGYKEVKPMVYASFFPANADEYPKLRDAIGKLKLSDAALFYEPVTITSIGTGFRCGFLGLLHMDIVQERLSREYDLDLVITSPTVEYRITPNKGRELLIHSATELPDVTTIEKIDEPWAKIEIITPADYLGGVLELLTKRRGVQKNIEYPSQNRVLLSFEIPLANIIVDFYDKLKGATSGYASLNYEMIGFQTAPIVKMDILVSGEKIEAFSALLHQDSAEKEGRDILVRLKDLVPKHQFSIALQAVIGGKIIARETIQAYRKDVTAGLYGGDDTRKKKVLEKQKKGKKRMKQFGRVNIPQNVFIDVFKQ